MNTDSTVDPATLTRLPDPPPKGPDEWTRIIYFFDRGSNTHLAAHFGNRDTTLITGDCRVLTSIDVDFTQARRPDVLIAFGINAQAYRARAHYVIDEQGKPPDFVMEIASESTAEVDTGPKRDDYAALGIPEYWRFDSSGEYYKTTLAGDRLAGDRYEPIEITVLQDGRHQGYSRMLNLILEWNDGDLNWINPDSPRPITTMEQERQGRLAAEARTEEEREGRRAAEARAKEERESRLAAEARTSELEEELRGLRGE